MSVNSRRPGRTPEQRPALILAIHARQQGSLLLLSPALQKDQHVAGLLSVRRAGLSLHGKVPLDLGVALRALRAAINGPNHRVGHQEQLPAARPGHHGLPVLLRPVSPQVGRLQFLHQEEAGVLRRGEVEVVNKPVVFFSSLFDSRTRIPLIKYNRHEDSLFHSSDAPMCSCKLAGTICS